MTFLTLDLEATGTDITNDRITEIAIVDSGGKPLLQTLVNPGKPIPAEVEAITGITNEMVKAAEPFKAIAIEVRSILEGNVVVGFGSNRFDLPLLVEECLRAGEAFKWQSVTWIDAGELFKIMEPRNLTAAVRFYCQREHDGAHRAEADATATMEVFHGQLRRYQHDDRIKGQSKEQLALLTNHGRALADPAGHLTIIEGELCFNTKRNKGVPVKHDLGYANWILRSDFPRGTHQVIREELAKLDRRDSESIFDSEF